MSDWHLKRASQQLNAGGVIAYAAEAVYGLGCDPFNEMAVHRLLAIKQRPIDKGLILLATDLAQVEFLLQPLSAEQRLLLQHTWPAPVTFTIACRPEVPRWLRGDFNSLAIRVSAKPQLQQLCRMVGPIVSTSANRSGQHALRTAAAVRRKLGPELDYVLPGICDLNAQPTEIRDLDSGRVLRAA